MNEAEITRILDALAETGGQGQERAWELLYPQMLRIAKAERRRWGGDWTLESRALANEAFVRLFGEEVRSYHSRRHFYNLVGRAIRQILVNYSTAQSREKRGGDAPTAAPLHDVADLVMTPEAAEEVLDLHEALQRFRSIDSRAAEIVELMFFAGLNREEVAEVVECSTATVGRDWALARAWLSRELGRDVPLSRLDDREGATETNEGR